MRALAHDLPLAVMPMHPMLDQTMVGQAVEAAGAGRFVPREATVAEIRAVVDCWSPLGRTARRPRDSGDRIRECRGAAAAADEIVALVASPAAHLT